MQLCTISNFCIESQKRKTKLRKPFFYCLVKDIFKNVRIFKYLTKKRIIMEQITIPTRMIQLLKFIGLAGSINGKTKLQKMLYLSKQEYGAKLEYDFELYLYGPFSEQISDDLNALSQLNMVLIQENIIGQDLEGFPIVNRNISLTENGKSFLGTISSFDKQIESSFISVLKDWNSKSLKEIISYVYSKIKK